MKRKTYSESPIKDRVPIYSATTNSGNWDECPLCGAPLDDPDDEMCYDCEEDQSKFNRCEGKGV